MALNLQDGWLKRQIEVANQETKAWSPTKRETMLCPGGSHDWGEEQSLSDECVLQVCQNCDRQRALFSWAEDWVYVKRGKERSHA